MGYDPDDPRGAQVRESFAKGLYRLDQGQRPNTNAPGPVPNGRGDKRGRFFT